MALVAGPPGGPAGAGPGRDRPAPAPDPAGAAAAAAGAGAPALSGGGGGPDLAGAVGLVLGVVGFVIGARTISDNSFLTHLATGRLILSTGTVPVADPYSGWAAGEPWTVQSWLASLVYAVLEAGPGLWSVRLLHGALGFGITLGVWALTAPARQLIVRVGLTGAALVAGTALWTPRPLLVGLAGMVLVLQVVQGRWRPLWLVPVFALWVNTHGSFALGLALLATVAAGAGLDQRRWPAAEARAAGLAIGGCLAGAVGPQGWHLLWFPVHLVGRGEALDRVVEWGSPRFASPHEYVFLGLIILIVVVAARGATLRQLVPAVAFMVAGLLAVRNVGPASVVIVTLAAPSLADLVGTVDGGRRGGPARAVAAAAVIALFGCGAGVAVTPALRLDRYPVDEIDWLDERSLVATPGVSLIHRDTVGNYLTYRYGSRARVFVDDRFDFHPASVLQDHLDLLSGRDPGRVLERRGADVVVWSTGSPLRYWIDGDPDWDVVVDGEAWFVACRRSSDVHQLCR